MSLSRVENMLAFNTEFVTQKEFEQFETTSSPEKKIVILSCMDTRLTELLPRALNIKNGDVKLIKNAGATVMHPFGSIARSVIVAVYEFGVEDIIVIGHHGCGMTKLDGEQVLEKAYKRGITPQTLATVKHAGVDINTWLRGFESEEKAVLESVEAIENHPMMPKDVRVHGWMMDPETGQVTVLK